MHTLAYLSAERFTNMLVLSRNVGQTILIGGGVTVCVLEIKGGQVKIGINAPSHTSVHRQEVAERIAADDSLPLKFNRDSDL